MLVENEDNVDIKSPPTDVGKHQQNYQAEQMPLQNYQRHKKETASTYSIYAMKH